ncbi:MAG: NUDIX hydrolase [Dehalococcoidia bacterium]
MDPPLFCQRCGASLEAREIFGRSRPVCPACSYVHFDDPKVAAGVLVSEGSRLLLALRNHEPRTGFWSFPGGFVDRSEGVEEAAIREVREETGLEVVIDELLGVYSQPGEPVIFVAYTGHAVGGRLAAGDEASDAAFFPVDALPELAFPHDMEIVERWRAKTRIRL